MSKTPTPGPWYWGAHSDEDIACVFRDNGTPRGEHLADVYAVADATLMAAAPDLLAACEEARDYAGQYNEALYKRLDAAIRKARGRVAP